MTGKIVGERFYLNGTEVASDKFWAAFARPAVDARGGCEGTPGDSLVGFKPLLSDALAVHPSQIAEAREDAKRKGVPVEFKEDGRPVFTSSKQFREYAKLYGFRHKGY